MVRKLAVVGSREISTEKGFDSLWKFLDRNGQDVKEIVSGGCPHGGDYIAEAYAAQKGFPTKIFKPDWVAYGKKAGFLRNVQIADHADACVALWDGQSKGTRHTINLFLDRGKEVHVLIVPLAVLEEPIQRTGL